MTTHASAEPAPLLLGFGGLSESGKDTAADYLVKTRGFAKVNMSEPIDAALYALNPIIRARLEPQRTAGRMWGWILGRRPRIITERYQEIRDAVGYTAAKRIPEVRTLLQRIGVKVGRNIMGDDVWVNIAARSIQKLRDDGIPICVSGIRFTDEQSLITRLGGTLVWVDRPGWVPEGSSGTSKDITEVSLDSSCFHLILGNTGAVADLEASADRLINQLESRVAA